MLSFHHFRNSNTLLAPILLLLLISIETVKAKFVIKNRSELLRALGNYFYGDPLSISNLLLPPIGEWDVSNVHNFSFIFIGQTTFNDDISQWDTSNAITMDSMFWNATSFNGNISNWDVSNVQSMRFMFGSAHNFNSDISQWDVSNVNNMAYMFTNATSYDGTNIDNWDVSNVTDMTFMFHEAHSFNGNISNWNVTSLKFANSMLHKAKAFNHTLCPWVDKLPNYGLLALSSMQSLTFQNTSCPITSDPDLSSYTPGPLCYSCAAAPPLPTTAESPQALTASPTQTHIVHSQSPTNAPTTHTRIEQSQTAPIAAPSISSGMKKSTLSTALQVILLSLLTFTYLEL